MTSWAKWVFFHGFSIFGLPAYRDGMNKLTVLGIWTTLLAVLIAVVILAGGVSMLSLKKSFFPETESRYLTVSVFYPGASPVEMEEGVKEVYNHTLN